MPRRLLTAVRPAVLHTVLLTVLAAMPGTLLVLVPSTPPAAAAAATAAAADSGRSRRVPSEADLLRQVRGLPGVVSARETGSPVQGRRLLRIVFRQPVDHRRPGGATFTQRVSVLHRSPDRPTVLVTEGYDLPPPFLSEPAQLLRANQVNVEHRYFGGSRPAGYSRAAWARGLTVRQAADDVHRVVVALRRVYAGRWVSTGVSKSGMAAVYHRRFHPGDVDGTIAYVAPNDAVDDSDAYNDFLAHVGTPSCRDALVAVQRRVLGPDRAWFLARTRRRAVEKGWTWRIVGSSEKAWEAAVVDTTFAFWQRQAAATACRGVPGPAARLERVFRWFGRVSPMATYADQKLRPDVPYYVQAAAQLGSPQPYEAPIADLLRFPGADTAATFVPAELRPAAHDDRAMADVDRWVRTRARHVVFLYGGNDPWGAEPFTCGAAGERRGCETHVAAGANHTVRIGDLPESARRTVRARLVRWATS